MLPVPLAFLPTNGMDMLVKPEHSWNALSPMLVTLLGTVIAVNPRAFLNASFPIVCKLLDKLIVCKFNRFLKASAAMVVPPVIVTVLNEAGTQLF